MTNDTRRQNNWLQAAAVLLLLGALVSILLISSGLLDPRPVGRLQEQRTPAPLMVPPGTRQIRWLDAPLPAGDYTIRLTAVLQRGEQDSLQGLVLGGEEEHITFVISPLGYAGIQTQGDALAALAWPLQTWPHVRPAGQPNEFWVDRQNGRLTVRLNRELLWSGDAPSFSGQMGVLGESFGATAVIAFPQLEIFVAQPPTERKALPPPAAPH